MLCEFERIGEITVEIQAPETVSEVCTMENFYLIQDIILINTEDVIEA